MADQIRVNGNLYSWGSIRAKIDGVPYHKFTEITFGDKRERAKLWGMGRHQAPVGRTGGKYTPDAVKLKGPKETMQAFRADLARRAPDRVSYGNVEFELVVQFVESASTQTPIHIEIQGCVVVSDASSNAEGADASQDDMEIDCMRIVRNGLTLFDSSQGVP